MTLRVALSVGEILLLVVVLAYFLRLLTKTLTGVGDNLEKIAGGVQAVESHCSVIGPSVDQLNSLLKESAGNLEQAAAAAERI
jgi:methyl-accepting chemotaxis protein